MPKSSTQYSIQLDGVEPSLFGHRSLMSPEDIQSWEAAAAQAKIKLQRELCASVLGAHKSGILTMSGSEVAVVRAMEASGKPLKDTHLAVLRALVERAK